MNGREEKALAHKRILINKNRRKELENHHLVTTTIITFRQESMDTKSGLQKYKEK